MERTEDSLKRLYTLENCFELIGNLQLKVVAFDLGIFTEGLKQRILKCRISDRIIPSLEYLKSRFLIGEKTSDVINKV